MKLRRRSEESCQRPPSSGGRRVSQLFSDQTQIIFRLDPRVFLTIKASPDQQKHLFVLLS